jgi:hypothetical protein
MTQTDDKVIRQAVFDRFESRVSAAPNRRKVSIAHRLTENALPLRRKHYISSYEALEAAKESSLFVVVVAREGCDSGDHQVASTG